MYLIHLLIGKNSQQSQTCFNKRSSTNSYQRFTSAFIQKQLTQEPLPEHLEHSRDLINWILEFDLRNREISMVRKNNTGSDSWAMCCLSDKNWLPCSCDLTPSDFCQWNYLKSQVYANSFENRNQTQWNINIFFLFNLSVFLIFWENFSDNNCTVFMNEESGYVLCRLCYYILRPP